MHAIAPSVSSGHVRLHSARPRPPRPRAEARQRTTKTLPTRQRRRRSARRARAERQRAEVQDAHCVRNSRQELIRETRREVRPCISGRGGWSDECGTNIIYYGGEDSPRSAISLRSRPAYVRIPEDDGANVTRERRGGVGAVPISPHLPGGRGGTVSPDSAQLVEERPWM